MLYMHDEVKFMMEKYGMTEEEAMKEIACEEVHMEMDGTMDIYDLATTNNQ